MTITATGKNKDDANRGNINATASHFNANDVEFNAPGDINLNAGYKTTESKATSSSNSFGVGASVNVGMEGGSASLTGNMSIGRGKTTSSSKTAMDTVVNGKNSVKINNGGGHLTLNGAEITNKNDDGSASNGKIAINTGSMTITTPQNTSKYDSDKKTIGLNASAPIGGGFSFGDLKPETPYSQGTPSLSDTHMHNNYASTEKTMSGIYAGKGGLTIDVTGKTQLNGGAISSEADASKNHMNTGSLEANSIQNHSKWSGLNITGNESLSNKHGIGVTGTKQGQDVINLPGNVLGDARTGFKGNSVAHDKHSTTNSAIGGNITVNAGSTTGLVTHDVKGANGYLENTFDPAKISHDFATQNKATDVLNEYTIDAVNAVTSSIGRAEAAQKEQDAKNGIKTPEPDFSLINKENVSSVAAGVSAIGGAVIGGGNVGGTAAGVVGGIVGNALLPDDILGKTKNPLDPKNQNTVNQQTGRVSGQAQDVYQDSSVKKNDTVKTQTNIKYDDRTDINKLATGIINDGIVGGLGAISGIITGNGNNSNIAIDATTGGLTALTQKAPKLKDNKNKKKPDDKPKLPISNPNSKVTAPITSKGSKQ